MEASNTDEYVPGDIQAERITNASGMAVHSRGRSLSAIFREVGKEYGYDSVEAEYVAFREFKVRWQRSYKWAEFKVSDYISDAPPEVTEALARSLFSKIVGGDMIPYSDDMCQWVLSDDFVRAKQPVYLRRSRGITKSDLGKFKDLGASMARLQEMGLAERTPDTVLTWTRDNLMRKVGYCSSIMKVIVVSSIFDDDNVPDFVMDYALYHEYLVMNEGRGKLGNYERSDTVAMERLFPRYREAEDWLNRLCVYL
jgi:hypothetical protein